MKPKKLILEIVVDRKHILLGNHFEIVEKFSPEAMSVDELRNHYNSLILSVHGYEDNSLPTFAITEVREFFQTLHKEWPYFLYFGHAGGQGLWNYMFCQLSTMSVRPKVGSAKYAVDYSPAELFKTIGDSLAFMDKALERAGLDESRARTREILKYYKLLKSGSSRN